MEKKGKRLAFIMCACIFPALFLTAVMSMEVPGVIELGSLSERFEAVTFNHGAHVPMAGDCGVCHHEHGANSSLPCSNCHSVTPEVFRKSVTGTFMACPMCHGDYDRDVANVPGLKVAYHRKCFQCHRGLGKLGLAPEGCDLTCHAPKVQEKSAKARQQSVPAM